MNSNLSIITVTLNSASHLPALIASLRAQTCKDFEWIVADGKSTDGTIELLKQASDLNISWVSEGDFGIYDAMNKAIKRSCTDYYLVVGSDDTLAETAVESIIEELDKHVDLDILVGQVYADGKLMKMKPGLSMIYGAQAYVTAHSVGSIFNKKLHQIYGYYSSHYPIAADGYFLKKIFANPDLRIKYTQQIFGTFTTTGISNTEILRNYCENLHIQLITEKFKTFQIFLFVLRYIKYRLT